MTTKIGNIMPLIMEAIAIRKRIMDAILALPDNPDIERIGESTGAFTIQSQKLDRGILSPSHYDFKYQYNYFVASMIRIPIENTEEWLEKTLNRGSIIVNKQTFTLSPTVIEHIRRLIDES